MSLHALIASQAIFWSVAAKIGMCDQIRKIHKEKSYGTISILFFVVGTVSYAWQVTDGMTGGGWDQVWEQGLGVILGLVIGCQICWYHWAGRFGWRSNKQGHYPGMKNCRACLNGFPVPCGKCSKGLMHGWMYSSRFQVRTPVIVRHCDRCPNEMYFSHHNCCPNKAYLE